MDVLAVADELEALSVKTKHGPTRETLADCILSLRDHCAQEVALLQAIDHKGDRVAPLWRDLRLLLGTPEGASTEDVLRCAIEAVRTFNEVGAATT